MKNLMQNVLMILLAALLTCTAQAQSPDVDRDAQEIFGSVMSPYCAGRLLRDCPSGAAAELKEKIEAKLKAGESKDAVLEFIYTTFGEEVRAAPKSEGFGWAAWVTPFIFLGGGVIAFIVWLRSRERDEGLL